jgi:predicted anti-sigma-YlaC factor YlaD
MSDDYRELLNDFLDGQLEPELHVETRDHLEGCPACSRELEQLRSLRSVTDRLPRSIEPPRDLWPGVEARLGTGDRRVPGRRRSRLVLRPRHAVAAVALLAIAFSLTQVRTKKAREGAAPAPTVQESSATSFVSLSEEWRRTEVAYERAAAELLEALDAVRDELPPETVLRIETNLEIVDDAIRESREAFEADPGNLDVLQLLAAVHEKRLDLLQQAVRHERL